MHRSIFTVVVAEIETASVEPRSRLPVSSVITTQKESFPGAVMGPYRLHTLPGPHHTWTALGWQRSSSHVRLLLGEKVKGSCVCVKCHNGTAFKRRSSKQYPGSRQSSSWSIWTLHSKPPPPTIVSYTLNVRTYCM